MQIHFAAARLAGAPHYWQCTMAHLVRAGRVALAAAATALAAAKALHNYGL
jgi:hypothetical protein